MDIAATRPRSRAEAKQASREALIEAATALFADKGLDVSLDEVCARAGYTRGAFYVHFKDRDALIAAVMARVGGGALNAVLGDSSDETLEAIVSRFAGQLADGTHVLSKKGGVRPYQLLDACARSPDIRQSYVALVEEATARLARIVEAGQRAGTLRDDIDAAQVASLLEALVIGLEIMNDVEAPVNLEASAATLFTLLRKP
jgi:TetR/AcrR family transcriptional repressor of nem operon